MKTTQNFARSGTIITLGQIFVAVAMIVFGIQHFLYANFVAELVPAWMPARLFWAYFVGAAFVVAAAGIVFQKTTRPAATLLGAMFFLFVLMLHIPRIATHYSDGNEWTSGFVALAMCGGAWILASSAPLDEREIGDPVLRLGRYFFGLAIAAFGIQHFVDSRLTVRIGPPWILGRPLWAYVAGVVLVGAGATILFGRKSRWAVTLLGSMIFLYSLLLYLPRIVAHPRDPGPWTSGFELLALSGCALVLGSTRPGEATG